MIAFFSFAIAMRLGIATRNGSTPVTLSDLLSVAPFVAAIIGFVVMYSRTLMRNVVTRSIGGISVLLFLGSLAAVNIAALLRPPSNLISTASWNSPDAADRVAYLVQAVLFWPGPPIFFASVSILMIAYAVFHDWFGTRRYPS